MFAPADRRLLDDLAHRAGAATHAAHLTADLRRSRERLVTMLSIPHPYEEGTAERFIEEARRAFETGERVNFAVVLREEEKLLGGVTLSINTQDDNGKLG